MWCEKKCETKEEEEEEVAVVVEEQLTNNFDEVFTIGPIWHQFMANVPNQQNSSENRIIV